MIILGLGLWFWSLFFIEFFLLTWFVEEEWGPASLVSLLIFMVLIWWLADIPIWSWIRDNPGTLFKWFVAYVVIGIGWTTGKYYFVLSKVRNRIKALRKRYDAIKHTEKTSWTDYVSRNSSYEDFDSTATQLVFWASFWPPSMFWTLLNDPIRKLFKFLIYDVFIGVYRKMYKKMVGDLLKDESKS